MSRLGLAIGLVCALAAAAHADSADKLFRDGKRLLAEKKYAEACTAFEASDKLDPGIGAKLNVALCYEEWGKLATAWRWYSDAVEMAKSTKDKREAKIASRLDQLDATVPRLTVRLAAGASDGVHVTMFDGRPVDATWLDAERRVDPGPHQIDYTVDSVPKSREISLAPGEHSVVDLTRPGVVAPAAPRPVVAVVDPGRTRRIVGLSMAGAGVAVMGVAGIVALGARSNYNSAIDDHCQGAKDMCDSEGLSKTHDARSTANIATAVTVTGLAAVAGGLVLYFTAPRAMTEEHALYLAPSVRGDGGAVVFGGAF